MKEKELFAEITFISTYDNLDKKYLILKKYSTIITHSNILGEGLEHDSVHYIENTYYKWTRNKSKIKLYWDSYKENFLCLDIHSYNNQEFHDIIKHISFFLKTKTKNMNINKDWNNKNVLD